MRQESGRPREIVYPSSTTDFKLKPIFRLSSAASGEEGGMAQRKFLNVPRLSLEVDEDVDLSAEENYTVEQSNKASCRSILNRVLVQNGAWKALLGMLMDHTV